MSTPAHVRQFFIAGDYTSGQGPRQVPALVALALLAARIEEVQELSAGELGGFGKDQRLGMVVHGKALVGIAQVQHQP